MKPISFIPAAIRSLDPECEFVYFDGTDEIRIDKSAKNITETQIRTEAIRLQVEWDAQKYARKRAQEYPDLAEQLDLLWHAIDTDTLDNKDYRNKFYTRLKKVKEDNPKG